MDYTNLKISDRQIRLITIVPPVGVPEDEAPLHLWMDVRTKPLPAAAPVDTGVLPPNYISFDHYLEDPPVETHVQELRELIAPLVHRLEAGRRLRFVKTLLGLVGKPMRTFLTVPTEFITDQLNGEERVTMMTGIHGPDGERRLWNQNGDFHAFQDEFGHNTMLFGNRQPLGHVGRLEVAKLNPFLRIPDPKPQKPKKIQDDNYIAMSYEWGPPEPTVEIQVNFKPVRVRKNLEAALRRFRKMEYFRQGGKIWIDALCINQDDLAEQQSQVQMMADIYRTAGNIIVWLGDTGGNELETEEAIDVLEALSADYRAEYFEAMDQSDPITAHTWRTMAQIRMETAYSKNREYLMTDEFARRDMLPLLYRFFDRPYWRRLWIIQELCMGRSGMPIVCGNRVTQWRYIRDGVLMAMSFLDLLEETAQEDTTPDGKPRDHSLLHVAQIAQLEIMGHRPTIPEVPTHLLPLIARSYFENGPLLGNAIRRAILLASQSACFRQHDRIYGMLSIPGLPDLGLKVDYSKKLADVYTEFTTACVDHNNLDFFALLDGGYMSQTDEHGNPQDRDKPSWVPDYGAKPARRIGTIDGEWHAGGMVPVSWGRAPCIVPASDSRALACMGKVVDTVDGLGAISHADIEAGAMVLKPGDDITALKQPTKTHDNAGKDPVIHEVLVGGTDRNGLRAPASFKCLYTAFPAEEPPRASPFYRNWHFLKSSAELLINGKPLSSYFSHLSPSDEKEKNTDWLKKKMETAAARQAMAARTKMRRLITTDSGLLGLAPGQTRHGDAVIIVKGYGKPLIARKLDTVDEHDIWYLLGEAYIDGMMNAEKMPLSPKRWHADETYQTSRTLEPIVFV